MAGDGGEWGRGGGLDFGQQAAGGLDIHFGETEVTLIEEQARAGEQFHAFQELDLTVEFGAGGLILFPQAGLRRFERGQGLGVGFDLVFEVLNPPGQFIQGLRLAALFGHPGLDLRLEVGHLGLQIGELLVGLRLLGFERRQFGGVLLNRQKIFIVNERQAKVERRTDSAEDEQE